MTELQLTEQSDDLLFKVPRDPKQPHYITETFDRKLRSSRQRSKADRYVLLVERRDGPDYLRGEAVAELIQQAGLTLRQWEIVCAKLDGDSYVELAEKFGTTKQAAYKIFTQALYKLRRHCERDPYHDLPDVYHAEIRRRGYGRRV